MLSEPITEKTTEVGQGTRLKYAASAMQGWRITMEDAHSALLEHEGSSDIGFFGVYDGHGGANIAQHAGKYAHVRVLSDPEFKNGNYRKAIKNGFIGFDDDMRKDPRFIGEMSGCTAVTLLVTKDKLFCGNAGDSRCVLSRKGVAVPLSRDHKPQNKEEVIRITEAGGFVQFGRVNGNLALSRAFGDFEFKKNPNLPPEKQVVTCDPEIEELEITPEDEFVVLACDGIWDVLSNQQVVNFVREQIGLGLPLGTICEKLMDRCLASDSSNGVGCDNMTVIIVALLEGATEEQFIEKCKSPTSISIESTASSSEMNLPSEEGDEKENVFEDEQVSTD